ncbi:MAG: phosphoglycerate mutase family protein [Myxococcales bacterium]
MTRLHLIRHGRASASADDYDQLQPLGETQARLLGEHLGARRQHFDRVYVGPLKRQRETLRLMRRSAGEVGSELLPYADFRRDVIEAYETIVADAAPGQQLAAVTSNGVIGVMLEHGVNLRPPADEGMAMLANSSVSVVEIGEGGAVLREHDRVEHLTDPAMVTVL